MNLRGTVGVLCMLLGGGLMTAAAVTLFLQDLQESEAAERAEELLWHVQQQVLTQKDPIVLQPAFEAEPAVQEPMMPAMTVDGHACLGMLEFPSLSLQLPVLADCSEVLLETAPCRQYGTAEDENLVIAGHNYRRHFKRLHELGRGDPVVFTDMLGKKHCYTVAATEVLGPHDLEKMLSGDWPLSLYTCTSGGEKRLTVRCVRDGA